MKDKSIYIFEGVSKWTFVGSIASVTLEQKDDTTKRYDAKHYLQTAPFLALPVDFKRKK